MAQIVLNSCTREKTEALVERFNVDARDFIQGGFQPWGVAINETPEDTGFKFIGILPIYYPFRSDTKEVLDQATELGKCTMCLKK